MTIEGLGKKFQDARIARGLTLDEAARLTKIRPSRLAEIEADDFSQFPSLAYAKGFLLIYGKYLDVDVTPYLDAFETSQQVTVDGYSYLQDQPAPKPRKVRPTRPSTAARMPRASRSRDRSSPFPILIAIGVIVVGFVAMRLILNIQRISPHQMVGVPQPTSSESPQPAHSAPPQTQAQAPVQSAPPQQTAAPSAAAVVQAPSRAPSPVAQAPSRAPSQAPVAMVEATKKPATPAPVISIPEAVVPAMVNNASATKKPAATPPRSSVGPQFENSTPAIAKASAAPTKEPEVRRAEPVKPEELAEAEAAQKPPEAKGQNQVAIKPLKKTYIKVVVDNGSSQPTFERWISPSDGPVEFRGQKISVRVLDRDAVRINKNGKPVSGDDQDVTVE